MEGFAALQAKLDEFQADLDRVQAQVRAALTLRLFPVGMEVRAEMPPDMEVIWDLLPDSSEAKSQSGTATVQRGV